MRDKLLKGILFDIDGTLINTETVVRKSIKESVKDEGHEVTLEEMFKYTGVDSKTCYKILKEKYNLKRSYEEWISFNYKWIKQNKDLIYVRTEIFKYVKELKGIGVKVGFVTNSTKEGIVKTFKTLGLDINNEVMVTLDDVKKGKPNPEPYLLGLKKIKLKAEEVLVVEDSIAGSVSGLEAGIETVFFPENKAQNPELLNKYNKVEIIDSKDKFDKYIKSCFYA